MTCFTRNFNSHKVELSPVRTGGENGAIVHLVLYLYQLSSGKSSDRLLCIINRILNHSLKITERVKFEQIFRYQNLEMFKEIAFNS